MDADKPIRPTKKQADTLEFIEKFIFEHGYSPSYREIMTGLNYNSVATASLHINSLIKRGHLAKRGRSARSIEIIGKTDSQKFQTNQIKASQEKWLIEKIEYYFNSAENSSKISESELDQLYVLVGALKVLGLEGASQSFMPRLSAIKTNKN